MEILAGVFALLVAAAGWYYLFYSTAASHLRDVETAQVNQRRVRLRKIAGLAMLLLALCFFALFWTFDPDRSALAFLVMLLAVLVLLATILVLAMIDLRLTWRLRRK